MNELRMENSCEHCEGMRWLVSRRRELICDSLAASRSRAVLLLLPVNLLLHRAVLEKILTVASHLLESAFKSLSLAVFAPNSMVSREMSSESFLRHLPSVPNSSCLRLFSSTLALRPAI